MKIARIKKPIWSTRKVNNLEGVRLLEVEILNYASEKNPATGKLTVVCDNLGAGIGEEVFITTGSAVIDVVFSEEAPFKTVVTAIIDHIYVEHELIKDKSNFIIPGSR